MEVMAGDLTDLPFQRRNVVEWSHRDQLTGALERARRETNHWSASTASAVHKYNKVVDQRALDLGDGRVQQTQRKQLEVFSTRVPGGSMQVIRSSTTSSSRSTIQMTQMGAGSWSTVPDMDTAFGDLQLSLHPLDLSSEKSKASVGRSIGWRRPPSRVARTNAANSSAAHQDRQDAPKETRLEITVEDDKAEPSGPIISFPSDDDSSEKTASIITASSASVRNSSSRLSIVESRKSCSSENLVKVGVDMSDELSSDVSGSVNGFLGRSSVLRRSLQYTRPPDFPTGTSVRRMRDEIEARGGVGGGIGPLPASPSPTPAPPAAPAKEQTLDKVKRLVSDSIATQNHSFVTVKSLNEVRGRLRSKVAEDETAAKLVNGEGGAVEQQPAPADTLVSEDHVLRRVREAVRVPAAGTGVGVGARVQSYVFGMENGQGAPDRAASPAKEKTVNGLRSEEWQRRRKSYGFEADVQHGLSLASKEDTWSDSGAALSPLLKHIDVIKRAREAGRIARPVSLCEPDTARLTNGSGAEQVERPKRTVVSLAEDADQATDMDRRRDVLRRRAEREISRQTRAGRSLTEPVSVSIPVVANDAVVVRADGGVGVARDAAASPPSEPTLLIDGLHYDETSRSQETSKRHSIAIVEHVDDEDDVGDNKADAKQGEAVVPAAPPQPGSGDTYLFDSTEDAAGSARKKRVEFSKTEVHFAAEPGRFNLVSTDDKPPPTNIVRGRRRQKLFAEQRINRSGLPEVRFGDSPLEQAALALAPAADTRQESGDDPRPTSTGVITVTMEGKLSPDHPAGLGAERLQPARTAEADDDKARAGLGPARCAASSEAETPNGTGPSGAAAPVPMWRSTVTLKNNSFASLAAPPGSETTNDGQAEFQRLLKSLRPTGKREIVSTEIMPEVTITTNAPTSRSKGFSTKVTLVPESTEKFVSEQHSTHKQVESSEQTNILHSLKLSVSPPSPSVDTPLSIALVGPSYPSLLDAREHRDAAEAAEARERRYRHHASKAERLVQLDGGRTDPQPRTASPNTVYIIPEQKKQSMFTDIGRTGFRTPSPVLPKSFSLVDSVNRRVDAATQVSRDDCVRTVSVREILDRLAVDKSDSKERIIEVVTVPTRQVADTLPEGRRSSPRPDRINGGAASPTVDPVIFREHRPTSPSPRDTIFSRLSARCDQDAAAAQESRVRSPGLGLPAPQDGARVRRPMSPAPAARRPAERDPHDPQQEGRVRSPAPPAPPAEQEAARLRRGSPVAKDAKKREYLHCHAPPGGHHIDVVERFLRSERERSHLDQLHRSRSRSRTRSRSPDGKGRPRLGSDAERWSRGRDAEAEATIRSKEINEIRERRRRSRSRDELRAREEQRGLDGHRRSRSRDELDERVSPQAQAQRREARSRSRSQDHLELDRGHGHGHEHGHTHRSSSRRRDHERHRSRSRDLLDDKPGREALETSKQRVGAEHADHERAHHASSRTSRSREELKEHVVNGNTAATGPEDLVAPKERPAPPPPEAAERRHRCKCADRDRDGRTRATPAAGTGAGAGAGAGHKHKSEAHSRRARAVPDQKLDKIVRKTRTHVAALASPIAHLVKPSKDRSSAASVVTATAPKRTGDVHLLMEPIRPVRRTTAPTKHSSYSSTVTNGTRGPAKTSTAPRRGNISDSNLSLSQGNKCAAQSRQGAEPRADPGRERQERPQRRGHRKPATD
ncbi:Rab3 GTPase-activating protein regulatory subunit [Frankliniella fusca]|uniref:Rab3 GTPase-activating protein regulatory subunit n=1 Tax=Frankliniella fusca TaxID=407009 RepID=A0AAE1HPG3_9NEOP|nr:Rab3 GTPase-activating protein regulatory subunit [Frankliniella fusca]